MTTEAISSFGTLLKMGDGATPENFTTVAEVRDITAGGITVQMEDVTNMDSPDAWVEKIATVLSYDDITFGINYKPTGATHNAATGLVYAAANRLRKNFQLVFPDAGSTTWTLPAYVAGFKPRAPVKGALSADVTVSVCGKPTLA